MPSAPLQLLLIENDAVDRAVIEHALQGHAILTTCAAHSDGLDLAIEDDFDCILMGISQPRLLALKELEALCSSALSAPVVVLTSRTDITDAELIRLGVQEILPTSPLPAALLRSIHHAIERTVIRQELRSTRRQFIQAQRMEAFGQIAGGIAHDFNNLLSIIQLFTSFVRKTFDDDDERAADLDEVIQASTRAAELIQQVLTFTRQKPSNTQLISLNTFLQRIEPLLRSALGSTAQLSIAAPEEDITIQLDPALLEQVLVSLTNNARDAMPSGGTLTLRIKHTAQSVLLTLTDTGTGMSDSTLLRALEPFFTTQEAERTGLGLSMCLGIIEQANGTLELVSRLGEGSTVSITLPRADSIDSTAADIPRQSPPTQLSGTERILLVEDIDKLRRSLSRTLTEHGYAVVEAANGLEALEVLQHEDVDLVLTDLVMPLLSGTALAATLAETSPELPIVLMTGYAKRYSSAAHPCILKPFKLPDLLSIIRGQLTPPQPLPQSIH